MIGFKDTNDAVATIEHLNTDATAEDILRARAYGLITEAIQTYMDLPGKRHIIIGGKREEWLVDRLRAIRERYLEPI